MIVGRAGVALWIVAGSLALSAGGVGCNRTAEPTPDGTRRGGAAVTALATTSATAAQPASPPDPALERNPDAIDLSTWQRVPDLPETCAVYVAPSPGETFRPLPLRPCGDRRGCTELLPSWGTETGDAVTRLIDASSGYTHFSALRGQQDAPRRALHVVETPDEKAVFAILSRSTDGRCSVDVTTGAQGIAIGVINGGIASDHVRFATATWQDPTRPKWITVDAGDLAKLRRTESYPRLVSFADDGIWLGEDSGFSRLDVTTGRIAIVQYPPALRARAGAHTPVRGGVIALLHGDVRTRADGLGFFDPKLDVEVLLPLRAGVGFEKLAVDRTNGEELFWIEDEQGVGCELFRAPVTRRAADFHPRSVTKIPGPCSLLKGPMLAEHGIVVHQTGRPFVTDPGELQIVEIASGLGWRIPPREGRVWHHQMGITQDAVWVSSGERAVRVGADWKTTARPGIVRLERASLGHPQALR